MKADQSYFVIIVLIIQNKSSHADIAHNSVNGSLNKLAQSTYLNKLAQSTKQMADPQAVYRFYYQIPSDNLLGVGA